MSSRFCTRFSSLCWAELFLVVLIAQNLVYLGVPVRISAWLLLGAALVQVWLCRHNFLARIRTLYANADIRTLAVIILLTILFHGIVPIRQGLEWYYGKGHDDQLNYVLIAEFLKEEPYGTSGQEIASASLVGQTCRVSRHCRAAGNDFRTRRRDDRAQKGENRPEHHYGRNQRLVGDRCKRGLRRGSHLLPHFAGNLSLRIAARDRDRPLHGWVRRAGWQRFSLLSLDSHWTDFCRRHPSFLFSRFSQSCSGARS